MESSGNVSGMPQGGTLRRGQQQVVDLILKQKKVVAQLPTGYGKTLAIDESYRLLKTLGICNRMLVIVPTSAQKNQYLEDHKNCIDIGFWGEKAVIKNDQDKSDLFIISIQGYIGKNGNDKVKSMVNGRNDWFIAIDESHHYGIETTWGIEIANLNYKKLLCLSATPFRKMDDAMFGQPDIEIKYAEAVKEGAVKPLYGHSYNYLVDLIDEDKIIMQLTVDELYKKFKITTPDGDQIDSALIRNKLRYTPKYVSPLVEIPLNRMIDMRNGVKNQAIVFCFSVNHAEFVCKQIKNMYPELNVEWVGMGQDAGKPPEENQEIILRFLNKKPGKFIDVLVNYNIAGEGIDSKNVTEIIFLRSATLNNRDLQAYGRASRKIFYNGNATDAVGNINFDTCCELSEKGFVGASFMDVFHADRPTTVENYSDEDYEPNEYKELDEYLEIRHDIGNIDLLEVNSGQMELTRQALNIQRGNVYPPEAVTDKSHHLYNDLLAITRNLRSKESEEFSEASILLQAKEQTKKAMSKVVNLTMRTMYGERYQHIRKDSSIRGDIYVRINSRKKQEAGPVDDRDIEQYKKHYQWLKNLEQQLLKNKLPLWLS